MLFRFREIFLAGFLFEVEGEWKLVYILQCFFLLHNVFFSLYNVYILMPATLVTTTSVIAKNCQIRPV